MVITPLEIESHEFKHKMRGCDPEEVKAFLSLVSAEFEKLVVANGKLQEEIAEVRERLGELRERERILKETMLTAQKLSQEMKDEAHKAREMIVKEGELKAEQLIAHAQQRVSELEAVILDLKLERDAFESGLRSMLEQHLKLIEMRKDDEDLASRLKFMRKKAAAAGGADPGAE
ncbi:MAG TPA: DivIVA domain-containing protein [Candidatus Polarisedimenticolia bacterium]|nr:DivIVA domain-containing protein [Candidatus Polarisedimenticolia bacterium]